MKTYLDIADNDYLFFCDIDETKPHNFNNYCATAQSICEKYLKHLVNEYCRPENDGEEKLRQDALRTHSIRKLYTYIKRAIPSCSMDFTSILKSDGYYFSARYPGDNYFDTTEEDVENCKNAVKSCKVEVEKFIMRINS